MTRERISADLVRPKFPPLQCWDMVTERLVKVEKRKYPAASGGSWLAEEVIDDEFGIWLFAPRGVHNSHEWTGLQLLSQEWGVAWWWDKADPLCTVDIATLPRLEADGWVYDDLEIDLWMQESSGLVGVVDIDEFAAAVVRVPYPEKLIVEAIESLRRLEVAMVQKVGPFGCGWDRLRQCVDERS